MPAILEQYRVSDFLEWHREKKLTLNPYFQRGSVWTPAARSYLIDTILRQLPIPKIYLRTGEDVKTKQTVREVVDGQQRLRAIIDFAEDKFALNKRAGEFAGLTYSTLDDDSKGVFLAYPLAVDQLLNADDEQVLEVFARLNSYSVSLNDPEKRHAKYQGDFKWAVHSTAQMWGPYWDKYKVLSIRERVRMLDDSLTAEMFGVLLKGVTDGGQARIESLYSHYDPIFDADSKTTKQTSAVLEYVFSELADGLLGTPLMNPPHFLMLFAAVAHALYGIPQGDIGSDMPERTNDILTDLKTVRNNLLKLASVIHSEVSVPGFEAFWTASQKSTQRIASRKVRFPVFYSALRSNSLERV